MNLQITVPYQKCPFKCPMCIASGRPVFDNYYKNNKLDYAKKLMYIINSQEPTDIVLTGNTDPTLDRKWLKDICSMIRNSTRNTPIELQTKNYNLRNYDLSLIDVLAYSITNSKDYLKAWSFRKLNRDRINRLVILLTKDLNFLTADNFSAFGFDQITFKVLQFGADLEANAWIEKNRMTDLRNIYNIIDRFNGSDISVRIDTNCQNSIDRYLIFREDGKTYKEW